MVRQFAVGVSIFVLWCSGLQWGPVFVYGVEVCSSAQYFCFMVRRFAVEATVYFVVQQFAVGASICFIVQCGLQ